jgi:hypothetical protein
MMQSGRKETQMTMMVIIAINTTLMSISAGI